MKSKKERLAGMHNEVCIGCGRDLSLGKEDDHMIGRNMTTLFRLFARPSIVIPSIPSSSVEEPPPTANPRNALEVIGRWLLSAAEYFELMCETFRQFGQFLIDLARQGYGAELKLP